MIKVLNIISDTNIGGAGRALLNYLAHSDRTEFVNSVIVPKGSKLTARIEALGVRAVEADIEADARMYVGTELISDAILARENVAADGPELFAIVTPSGITGNCACVQTPIGSCNPST